jgi:FkbM family methyltransferase
LLLKLLIAENIYGKFELCLDQWIDRQVYTHKVYDQALLNVCAHYIRPGDIVFDIGAHHGFLTIPFAAMVTALGKVYAFEPHPISFQRLRANIALNPAYPIVAIAQSISHSQNFFKSILYTPCTTNKQWPELSCLFSHFYMHKVMAIENEVLVTSIDVFREKNHIDKINFIKIDAQGGEGHVLKGAQKTIAQCRPIIVMEHDPLWIKRSQMTLKQVLKFIPEYIFYEILGRRNAPIQSLSVGDIAYFQRKASILALPFEG